MLQLKRYYVWFFFWDLFKFFTHLFFRWKVSVVSMDQTITAKLDISTGYLFKACVRYILSNFHFKTLPSFSKLERSSILLYFSFFLNPPYLIFQQSQTHFGKSEKNESSSRGFYKFYLVLFNVVRVLDIGLEIYKYNIQSLYRASEARLMKSI